VTYQQALAILYAAYPNPTLVTGTQRLQAMTAGGVPRNMASDINRYSYTAARTGASIETELTKAGLITPTTTTTAAPPVAATTAPATTTYAPSALASQESGAIGAASIASQMGTLTNPLATTSTATTTPTTTAPTYDPEFTRAALAKLTGGQTLTNDEKIALGMAPATTTASTTSSSSGDISLTLNDGTNVTVPSTIVTGGNTYTYNGTNWVRTNEAGLTETLYKSDLAGYLTPIGGFKLTNGVLDRVTTPPPPTAENTVSGGGTLPNPLGTTTGTTAGTGTGTTAGTGTGTGGAGYGPAGDSIALLEYNNAIAAAGSLEERAKIARDLAVRLAATRKETDVRLAEANAYNAGLKSVASLGARGLQGLAGLKIAAQRAARFEPMQRRKNVLEEYGAKVSSADILLEEELSKAKQAKAAAETAMMRANKLASDLTKSTGTVSTASIPTFPVPTMTLSNASTQQLIPQTTTTTIPTLQAPRM